MALNGLCCADVPFRSYSLTHSLVDEKRNSVFFFFCVLRGYYYHYYYKPTCNLLHVDV